MFDPTKPAPGSPDSSAEMRVQLNGLKALIDAIPAGPEGPPGPPFASAVVDGVSTLNPGDSATVGASFDGTNVHLTFAIPRGADGIPGPQGNDGPQGPDGPQGATGEVSNAALAAALAGTSANTNGVGTLDTPFSNDPPTLADIELLRAKINELILNGRR